MDKKLLDLMFNLSNLNLESENNEYYIKEEFLKLYWIISPKDFNNNRKIPVKLRRLIRHMLISVIISIYIDLKKSDNKLIYEYRDKYSLSFNELLKLDYKELYHRFNLLKLYDDIINDYKTV